jgi:hypothetical protein
MYTGAVEYDAYDWPPPEERGPRRGLTIVLSSILVIAALWLGLMVAAMLTVVTPAVLPGASFSIPGLNSVLGVLPGIVGSLQANEALKLALDIGEPLIGRLLLFDALATKLDEVAIRRDPGCPVCGENPTITEYIDYAEFCGV